MNMKAAREYLGKFHPKSNVQFFELVGFLDALDTDSPKPDYDGYVHGIHGGKVDSPKLAEGFISDSNQEILAEKFISHFRKKGYCSWDFATIAEEHYKPLLEKARQEGYEKRDKEYSNLFVDGLEQGKRQAIEDIKWKWDIAKGKYWQLEHGMTAQETINHFYKELFGQA